MNFLNKEDRKPIISMGDVTDVIVGLEAYLIASALTSWTRKIEGIGHKVIDYIKIDFDEGLNDDIRIFFKITLRPSLGAPSPGLEVTWDKRMGYVGSSPICTWDNRKSKEDVIADIKKIICTALFRLAKENRDKWKYLVATVNKIR